MFDTIIDKLKQEIAQQQETLNALQLKAERLIRMEDKLNGILTDIAEIAEELQHDQDILKNFEQEIRNAIAPFKPVKEQLTKFKDIGFTNLKSSRNDFVKFYGELDIQTILIAMNDKRHAKKWIAYFESEGMVTELFAGNWDNQRYTVAITVKSDGELTIDDDLVNSIVKLDFTIEPQSLNAPAKQETNIKLPPTKPTPDNTPHKVDTPAVKKQVKLGDTVLITQRYFNKTDYSGKTGEVISVHNDSGLICVHIDKDKFHCTPDQFEVVAS